MKLFIFLMSFLLPLKLYAYDGNSLVSPVGKLFLGLLTLGAILYLFFEAFRNPKESLKMGLIMIVSILMTFGIPVLTFKLTDNNWLHIFSMILGLIVGMKTMIFFQRFYSRDDD